MRLLLTGLLAAASAVQAQTPTEVLPPVKTELKRDGTVLPYKQINSLLSKLAQHGEGLFRMDFQVNTEKTKLALSDIRLAVRSDEADYPIRLAGDGRFDLPVLPEAEARTADLATNAVKGQLSIRGTIELTTPPDQLTLGQVRHIMRVAHRLREELLPFYLRWLFPRLQAVRVCSATPTWELEWRENGQLLGLPLPAVAAEREPDAKKGEPARPCMLLTGQENWPDAARLVAPAQTRLSLKL
ncbi:MAG: hypothetical protein ACK44A_04580 [Roseateles sp.]